MRGENPKVYFYTDEEVGVPFGGPDEDFIVDGRPRVPNTKWPRFVWYEWPNFDETDNPYMADVFVVRQRLISLTEEQVMSLPYLAGNERRHVFFDLGSDGRPECYRDFSIPAIFFRGCCTKQVLANNPTTIAWPWPVHDYGAELGGISSSFGLDVVFQGKTNHLTRRALKSFERPLITRGRALTSHLAAMSAFYPHLRDSTSPQAKKRAAEYRESYIRMMDMARVLLCPTSVIDGIVRYRLYDGMTLGRITAHICDGCVMPLADRIDWGRILITIRESDADHVGEIIADWLNRHNDNEIRARGLYAREMWDTWLRRDRWGETIGSIVREKLKLIEETCS